MSSSRSVRRQRLLQSTQSRRARLFLEVLENRTLPSGIGLVADNATHSVGAFDPDTNTALGSAVLPGTGQATGDAAVTADGKLGFVTDFNNRVWVVDLANPATPAVEPTAIAISNPGEDIAITPDQKFLVVSDGAATSPLSVVDIASRAEIGTFFMGSDANSVDVSETGSVLVTSVNSARLRRLTIDCAGTLTDTVHALSTFNP